MFDWDNYVPPPKPLEKELAYQWLMNRGGVAKAIEFGEEFYHSTFEELRAEGRVTTVTFEGDSYLYYSLFERQQKEKEDDTTL